MEKRAVIEMEQTFCKSIGVDLRVNDLRILVRSLHALEYLSGEYGEDFLDPEAVPLMDRLEGLYNDEVRGDPGFGVVVKAEA